MNANKPASRRSLQSDLARVDAHVVTKDEYEELPELSEEMLARAKINKGGRPVSSTPPGSPFRSDCQSMSSSGGRQRVQVGKRAWPNV